MNNGKLVIESVPLTLDEPAQNTQYLHQREEQLIRIIEALQKLQGNKEWSTLKIEIFDSLVDTLKATLFTEARKESHDSHKLNRLAGELKWAERYADLYKLEQEFKNELVNIKLKLHGTS